MELWSIWDSCHAKSRSLTGLRIWQANNNNKQGGEKKKVRQFDWMAILLEYLPEMFVLSFLSGHISATVKVPLCAKFMRLHAIALTRLFRWIILLKATLSSNVRTLTKDIDPFLFYVDRSASQHGGSPSSHCLHTRRIVWLGVQSSLRRLRPGQLRKRRRRHSQLSARRFR